MAAASPVTPQSFLDALQREPSVNEVNVPSLTRVFAQNP